jgi:hypothetical protein
MKRNLALVIALLFTLGLTGYVFAQPDTKPATKVEAKKAEAKKPATAKVESKAAASQPTEPTEPKEVPKDVSEAIDAGKQLVEQAKAKQWFAFSAGAIWLLMFGFKVVRKKWFTGMPKRVLWIVVPVLSVAATVLAKLQADLSWGAALTVLASGPSVAFLNDMVKRGIMGKEPTAPVNGNG